MRILWREWKKLMNFKLVLLLLVFTGLFYPMFIHLPFYYNYVDGPGTEKVYMRLYQKFGTTLSEEEREHGLRDMREELQKELDETVRRTGKELWELELAFEVQEIDRIYECKEYYGKGDVSTLSDSLLLTMSADIPYLSLLCMICCMVLIIPYYIRERHCRVIPLFVSTRFGRKQFVAKLAAVLIGSTAVCLFQFLVYTGLNAAKGNFMFWNCPVNTLTVELWHEISFGQWYLLALLLVWIFVLAVAVAAHLISRISRNYVMGIGLAIPLVLLGKYGAEKLLSMMFQTFTSRWLPWGVVPCFAAVAVVMCLYLKRDKRREFA